jgi:hypothetical protein
MRSENLQFAFQGPVDRAGRVLAISPVDERCVSAEHGWWSIGKCREDGVGHRPAFVLHGFSKSPDSAGANHCRAPSFTRWPLDAANSIVTG